MSPSKWRNCGKIVEKFCDETSLLGFQYIRPSYRPWFRVVAALIILLCIGLTGYQVAERLIYYVNNPAVSEIAETTLTVAKFPNITICNMHHVGLSNVMQKLVTVHSEGWWTFDLNNTAVDVLEVFVNLYSTSDSNAESEINKDLLNLFLRFPEIAARLREIAEHTQNAGNVTWDKGGTHVWWDYDYTAFLPLITDPQMAEELQNIIKEISVFPTKALLYLIPFSDAGDFDDKLKSYGFPFAGERLSFKLPNIFLKDPVSRKCFHDWPCRIRAAAESLDAIAGYHLHQLISDGAQTAEEFILYCSWKSRQTCSVSKTLTKNGVCFQVHPKGNSDAVSANVGDKLDLVVNLEIYDAVLGMGDGSATIHMYPPESGIGGETVVTVSAGSKWNIAINRIQETNREKLGQCGDSDLQYFDVFAGWKCLWEQETDQHIRSCGCVPRNTAVEHVFHKFPEKRHCTVIEELKCDANVGTIGDSYESHENHYTDNHCALDCIKVTYQTDLMSTSLNPKSLPMTKNKWRKMKDDRLKKYNDSTAMLTSLGKIGKIQMVKSMSQLLNTLLVNMQQTIALIVDGCVAEDKDLFHLIRPRNNTFHGFCDQVVTVYDTQCLQSASNDYERLLRISDALKLMKPQVESPVGFFWNIFIQHERYRSFYILTVLKSVWHVGFYFQSGRPELMELEEVWFRVQTYFEVPAQKISLDKIIASLSKTLNESSLIDFPQLKSVGQNVDDIKMALKSKAACVKAAHELIEKTKNESREFFDSHWIVNFRSMIEELQQFLPGPEYDRENLAAVSIYFAATKKETIKQVPSYSGFGLMADIGGTLGLYLGATVLVFLELIVFVLKLCCEALIVRTADVVPM